MLQLFNSRFHMDMNGNLGLRLTKLPRSWRAVLDHRLAPLGLTQTRWVTLYSLYNNGNGIAQCDLAVNIGVEAPSLVRTLDLLASQGLIERRVCENDRRTKRIFLTDRAKVLIERINDIIDEAHNEILAGIDEQEVINFSQTLAKIESNSNRILKEQQALR